MTFARAAHTSALSAGSHLPALGWNFNWPFDLESSSRIYLAGGMLRSPGFAAAVTPRKMRCSTPFARGVSVATAYRL